MRKTDKVVVECDNPDRGYRGIPESFESVLAAKVLMRDSGETCLASEEREIRDSVRLALCGCA